MNSNLSIQTTDIESRIHIIRNQQVMIDHDLAELYGVETNWSQNVTGQTILNRFFIIHYSIQNYEKQRINKSRQVAINDSKKNQTQMR